MDFRIVKAPDLLGWEQYFRAINTAWLEELFTVTPADERQLNAAPAILENGGAVLFVLKDDVPVGTAALILEKNGDVELAKMGVQKAWRGKGAGRLLMDACLEEAGALAQGVIFLETLHILEPAVRLYESVGFVKAGEEHVHPLFGRTTFRMELLRRSVL
jgi:GNAT superfamily N-acetyltransferase